MGNILNNMNFGKCSSVLFTYSRPRRLPSVKIALRGGGWGWRGRILEPAVGDDEKAGKPSS